MGAWQRYRLGPRGRRGFAPVAVGLVVVVGTGAVTQQQPAAGASSVAVNPAPTPAFNPDSACANGSPAYNFPGSADAADPQIVYVGGTYYAFTTGNALGNHLAALTSSSPNSGFASYTGTCFGSTALVNPSGWEEPNTQTSPGVFNDNGRWIMFYDASQSGHPGDTGFDCLAVATANALSPTNAQFTDSGSPLLCQPTGSIDPSPFIDPVTGQAYLVWKQNDGGSAGPAMIWSQPLAPSGTAFAAGTSPSLLLTNNTVLYPWGTTVEDPSMAYTDRYLLSALLGRRLHAEQLLRGHHHLLEPDRGLWGSQPDPRQLRDGAGTGWWRSLLRSWRELVDRLRRLAGGLGRMYQLQLWRGPAPVRGAHQFAQQQSQRALYGTGGRARWLSIRRFGRGHLHLRQPRLLWLRGRPAPQPARRGHGRHP